METTQRTTVSKYSCDPLQESSLEIETQQPTLTSDDKKAGLGVWSAADGIRGCLTMITLAIPILVISISRHYQDQCPIQPKIPLFLYVGGIISLIFAIYELLISVVAFIRVKKSLGRGEGEAERAATTVIKFLAIITIGIILLKLAAFIWSICGMFWTFGVFSRVSYNINDHERYCNRVVYVFAIIRLVLGLIETVGRCLSSGLKAKRKNFG